MRADRIASAGKLGLSMRSFFRLRKAFNGFKPSLNTDRVDVLGVRFQHLFGGTDEVALNAVEGAGVFTDLSHVVVPNVGGGWDPIHLNSGRLGHHRTRGGQLRMLHPNLRTTGQLHLVQLVVCHLYSRRGRHHGRVVFADVMVKGLLVRRRVGAGERNWRISTTFLQRWTIEYKITHQKEHRKCFEVSWQFRTWHLRLERNIHMQYEFCSRRLTVKYTQYSL